MACIQTIKKATDNKAASIILCSAATIGVGLGKELSDSHFDNEDLLSDLGGVSLSAFFLSF